MIGIKEKSQDITLIVPDNEQICSELPDVPLMIKFTGYNDYKEAFRSRYSKNRNVKGVIIDYHSYPISFCPIEEKEHTHPLYIYVNGIGDFRFIIDLLPVLRGEFTFFFPPDKKESYRNVKILSSMGIDCGIELTGPSVLWDEVRLLIDTVARSIMVNGAVQPFSFIKKSYNPREYLDFNIPFLNSPLFYLYADDDMNIYLTKEDMASQRPAGKGAEFVARYQESEIYKREKHRWKEFFLTLNTCSTCPAFRICLGKFSVNKNNIPLCKDCFSHFLSEIDNKKDTNPKLHIGLKKTACQPSS